MSNKNVVIFIEGGLGDQVDSEPVVRKLKVLYPNSKVILITQHSEVFDHLGLDIYKPGQFIVPDDAFIINTLKPINHVSKNYMVHKLCHGVDYASLQCLKGTLTAKEKEITLSFEPKHLAHVEKLCGDTSKLVVLHPGLGWASKTFPDDVWDSWIDFLLANGYKVALIGKRVNEAQGALKLKPRTHPNFVDLIDKLSLKETFALLSKAPILISNDSSPIHIAGAFDNYIGVIATCKHPELILPYRGGFGNVWHKAKSLEKARMYDEYNHLPSKELSLIYYLPDGITSIRPYLPSPLDILCYVQSILVDKT
jgi:ADP-heptose:LPS heptosyltransferase